MPKTASDQIMILFAFLTATLVWGGLFMGLQGRKAPPEFKDIALFLGGGVLTAVKVGGVDNNSSK